MRSNVPTSSVLLLVLPALVCIRGYKWAREGEGPKSLVEGLKSAESLLSSVLVRHVLICPFLGRPASPFIGEGEGTGYREKKKEKSEGEEGLQGL